MDDLMLHDVYTQREHRHRMRQTDRLTKGGWAGEGVVSMEQWCGWWWWRRRGWQRRVKRNATLFDLLTSCRQYSFGCRHCNIFHNSIYTHKCIVDDVAVAVAVFFCRLVVEYSFDVLVLLWMMCFQLTQHNISVAIYVHITYTNSHENRKLAIKFHEKIKTEQADAVFVCDVWCVMGELKCDPHIRPLSLSL